MNTDFITDEAVRLREELLVMLEMLKIGLYQEGDIESITNASYDTTDVLVKPKTSAELNKFLGEFKIIEGGAAL